MKPLTRADVARLVEAERTLPDGGGAPMTERWAPIPGWEAEAEVSSLGRIRSLGRFVEHARHGRIWIQPRMRVVTTAGRRRNGDPIRATIKMSRTCNELRETVDFGVAALVLLVFDRAPRDDEQAWHIDGDPMRNEIGNLVWCTATERALRTVPRHYADADFAAAGSDVGVADALGMSASTARRARLRTRSWRRTVTL